MYQLFCITYTGVVKSGLIYRTATCCIKLLKLGTVRQACKSFMLCERLTHVPGPGVRECSMWHPRLYVSQMPLLSMTLYLFRCGKSSSAYRHDSATATAGGWHIPAGSTACYVSTATQPTSCHVALEGRILPRERASSQHRTRTQVTIASVEEVMFSLLSVLVGFSVGLITRKVRKEFFKKFARSLPWCKKVA